MATAEVVATISQLVSEVLSLPESGPAMTSDTLLLGSIPEFDSMSIVSVIAALEDDFHIQIPDDELSAEIFESVGSLADFVERLLREG